LLLNPNSKKGISVPVSTYATTPIKNGWFEGDRIVVQRAHQLYAPSLRGNAPKAIGQEKPATTDMSGRNVQDWAVSGWGWVAWSPQPLVGQALKWPTVGNNLEEPHPITRKQKQCIMIDQPRKQNAKGSA
jgi:hypothetical protein